MVCGAKCWQHGDGFSSAGWVKKKKKIKCNLTGMQLVPGNEGQVSKCVIQQVYDSIRLEGMSFSSPQSYIVYRFR